MIDLLLILLILAGVVVFLSAPLRRAPGALAPVIADAVPVPEVADLEAARDAKLRELRDAELDHGTGKLSDEDYQALDGTLRAEALEILRALDQARERVSPGQAQDRPAADTITG